jgi:hypothetical protein
VAVALGVTAAVEVAAGAGGAEAGVVGLTTTTSGLSDVPLLQPAIAPARSATMVTRLSHTRVATIFFLCFIFLESLFVTMSFFFT